MPNGLFDVEEEAEAAAASAWTCSSWAKALAMASSLEVFMMKFVFAVLWRHRRSDFLIPTNRNFVENAKRRTLEPTTHTEGMLRQINHSYVEIPYRETIPASYLVLSTIQKVTPQGR